MNPNPVLDHVIAKESFAEILDDLTARELAVVALRLDGLQFNHVGELLGLRRGTVCQRMQWARARLRRRFPHIDTLIEVDS
jgi:DNA-directed RNA polymerase specialized sigma24 family protein